MHIQAEIRFLDEERIEVPLPQLMPRRANGVRLLLRCNMQLRFRLPVRTILRVSRYGKVS